jgi:spore maturation protein CgeB
MAQQMSDVWTLETGDEEWASEDLGLIIGEAMKFKGTSARAYLRKLWGNESWKSIKEKLHTEGSVWYVWYLDSVKNHLINRKRQQINYETNNLINDAKQLSNLNINLNSQEVAIILNSLALSEQMIHSGIVKTAIHDLISRIETAENN